MNISRQKTQSGFALLVFLIVLMGLGGLALTGFSQQALKEVEANKLAHNKRVLQQAKQALLFYAYNYPEISKPILPGDPPPRGPGRLPCADIDNDGDANTTFGDCIALGRLPWDEPSLNLSDLRDADGQRLWYAVSENFATNVSGGNIVNSDSFGNITVRDQSGRTIFDGSDTVARSGVAAVIIAPGAVTSRNGVAQDRSVIDDDPFDTVADDDPGVIDSINYLDLVVDVEDNADFGQNSSTNGFILGPIDNNGTDVVNDQFIIITAAEVIEMAEKAVLDAYRNAVNDYLNNTDDTYPWLYNYAGVPDINGLSTYFPGNSNFATELLTNLDNFGRIPTIFTDYFTLSDSIEIESEIGGTISFNYPVGTLIGRSGGSDFKFNGGTQSLNFASASVLTNVQFSDQGGQSAG